MEAVPRMPMLAFELKISSEPVEFTPLLKYVSNPSMTTDRHICGHQLFYELAVTLSAFNQFCVMFTSRAQPTRAVGRGSATVKLCPASLTH